MIGVCSQGFTLGWYETPPWGFAVFRIVFLCVSAALREIVRKLMIGVACRPSRLRSSNFRFVFLRASVSLREIVRKLRFPATFFRARHSDFPRPWAGLRGRSSPRRGRGSARVHEGMRVAMLDMGTRGISRIPRKLTFFY
jgi:hypothetical protein